MTKFLVRYNPEAIEDLSNSFEWGVKFWGAEQARKWYNEMERLIQTHLSSMPQRYALAPENSGMDVEVRQIIYGRYRVLFTIQNNSVLVLYIRGPYSGK